MSNETPNKRTTVTCAACGNANIFNQPYPYHAGFADQGFLYNDAGNLTLTWSCFDPAFEALVGQKNPWALGPAAQQRLEEALLPAPTGGRWRFSNPARCLGCGKPISDPIGSTVYYLVYDGSVRTDDTAHNELSLGCHMLQTSMKESGR